MLDYITKKSKKKSKKKKVATKNVLWTLFMLNKLKRTEN